MNPIVIPRGRKTLKHPLDHTPTTLKNLATQTKPLDFPRAFAKYLTFSLSIPFFMPFTPAHVTPFLAATLAFCLFLHHIMPNKFPVSLSFRDKIVIGINLVGSYAFSHYTVLLLEKSGNFVSVSGWSDVPYYEYPLFFFWVVMDEVFFFLIHRFAHKKHVYNHILYSHKMHHKFKGERAKRASLLLEDSRDGITG